MVAANHDVKVPNPHNFAAHKRGSFRLRSSAKRTAKAGYYRFHRWNEYNVEVLGITVTSGIHQVPTRCLVHDSPARNHHAGLV